MADTDSSLVQEPYSAALFEAVLAATPQWVQRRLHEIAPGVSFDVDGIVTRVQSALRNDLASLLRRDVDQQQENPLHVIRRCAETVRDDLEAVGVAHVQRDEFETRAMPNDVYAFGPLTWRDLSEEVHEAGISWGAWKAATILSRRRAEGKLQ